MPIVHLTGHSNVSPLESDRHLSQVPIAELAAILTESLSKEAATELTFALMERLGVPMLNPANAFRLFCYNAAPGNWSAPPEPIENHT